MSLWALQATQPQPIRVAGSARQEPVASSASTTVLSQRRLCVRHAGALRAVGPSRQARRRSEDPTPAASTTSERSASAGPSVDGAGRASTVPVAERPHARRPPPGPRASASASSASRLEVDESRKPATLKRGPPRRPRERQPRWLFFFSRWGRFPSSQLGNDIGGYRLPVDCLSAATPVPSRPVSAVFRETQRST